MIGIATMIFIVAPFFASLVMNFVHGKIKTSLEHIPIIQLFIKITWLCELKKLWYQVEFLNTKLSGMHMKDLKMEDLKKLNKARSRQIRLETHVVESRRYEIVLESAPQAILQISTVFLSGVLTISMLCGK